MKAKLHRLPSPPPPDGTGDHLRLTLAEFAEEIGKTRQTVGKWAKYHPEKFPKGSLQRDPQGRYVVDMYLYNRGYTPVN